MVTKPDRPREEAMRLWRVIFENGEVIEIEALCRAEARHYSVSLSMMANYGPIRHYTRIKSVRIVRDQASKIAP